MTFDELKKLGLGDLAFKAEDFPFLRAILHRAEIDGLVEHANRILREKLERAPEVAGLDYVIGTGEAITWSTIHKPMGIKARLVCIEEIKK